MGICKVCSSAFEHKVGRGRKRHTCNKCFESVDRDVRQGKVFNNLKPQQCAHCRKEYFRNRKTKYCTSCSQDATDRLTREKRASGEYKENRTVYSKECAECKGKFETKNKNTTYCSAKCANRKNPYSQRRVFVIYRGKNHLNNWDYKKWRKSVYERDRYTCQLCGYDRGGKLEAHHLEGWNDNPDLRYDVDNGVSLCVPCHTKFHKEYGYGKNTRQQYIEFSESERMIGVR